MDWKKKSESWVTVDSAIEAAHRRIATDLMEAAEISPGERVLDIGCGTGASVFLASQAVGADGFVRGIDLAPKMIERAIENAQGLSNVAFQVGDASAADFGEHRYDVVLSLFGLMFFEDPAAALVHIATALRPAGRIVFVAWGPPPDNPWFSVPGAAVAARLGEQEPPPPGAPSPFAFSDTDYVFEMLKHAGLGNIAVKDLRTHLAPQGGAEGAAALMMKVGMAADVLAETGGSSADADAIEAAITQGYARFEEEDGLRIPARVLIYSATRPD